MTKRDFVLIARNIAAEVAQAKLATDDYSSGARMALWSLARLMADDLATTNPCFDRRRFLQACGLEN